MKNLTFHSLPQNPACRKFPNIAVVINLPRYPNSFPFLTTGLTSSSKIPMENFQLAKNRLI